jgi:hypothetical protein
MMRIPNTFTAAVAKVDRVFAASVLSSESGAPLAHRPAQNLQETAVAG